MSDKKGWGSTVAGWFIERDEASTPVETDFGSVPEPTPPATTDNYTTPSPTQSVFQTVPPPATGGQVDFAAVFVAAGVDQDEQQRVARTPDLLKSLPAGTDAAVKKQIVEASLKAFGVPIEKIIEATVEEIQAPVVAQHPVSGLRRVLEPAGLQQREAELAADRIRRRVVGGRERVHVPVRAGVAGARQDLRRRRAGQSAPLGGGHDRPADLPDEAAAPLALPEPD